MIRLTVSGLSDRKPLQRSIDLNDMEAFDYVCALKKVQVKYDSQINQIANELSLQRERKSKDTKECECLAREALRLSSRWRRMSSLLVETFTTINNEIDMENEEIQDLEDALQGTRQCCDTLDSQSDKLQEHIEVLDNSLRILNDSKSIAR